MTTQVRVVDEIEETKKQYLVILTGAYFVSGFFWVFSTLGSVKLLREEALSVRTLFSSMIVLMLSNGIWEVVTGWYADKFKRRFSISAGFFFCFVGFLIMGMTSLIPFLQKDQSHFNLYSEPRFLLWLVGVTVWSLGPALLSGAQEAWLVDRCNFLSVNPPEPVDDVFKKSARQGVIAKASGLLICFFILYFLVISMESPRLLLAFSLAGGIGAVLSFLLCLYSRRLQEEYWTDPKYQFDESLFTFLWMGMKDLWKVPYRWFTLAFIGATSLNYALSSMVWPYLGEDTRTLILGKSLNVGLIAGGIIVIELVAGYLSRAFSRRIDLIKPPQWRMPAAALMYLIPVLPIYLFPGQPDIFLLVLIAATFLFRTAHASVFGTLNTVGQSAIESDERRAVLVSMSSALAAFFMATALLIVIGYGFVTVRSGISGFWAYVTLPSILMLAIGGYLVARKGRS
jgi:MFS family permease